MTSRFTPILYFVLFLFMAQPIFVLAQDGAVPTKNRSASDSTPISKFQNGPFDEAYKKKVRYLIIWIRQELLRRSDPSAVECVKEVFEKFLDEIEVGLLPEFFSVRDPTRKLTTSQLEQELYRAQNEYRTIVREMLASQMGKPKDFQRNLIRVNAFRTQAGSTLEQLRKDLPKEMLRRKVGDTNACKPAFVQGEVIGKLDAAYIDASVANEFYNAMLGMTKLNLDEGLDSSAMLFPEDRMWDKKKTSWVAYYIHKLGHHIGTLQPNRRYLGEIPRDIRKFVKTWDRNFAVREVSYLAKVATMFHPNTGWQIEEGVPRDDLARVVLLNLSEYIDFLGNASARLHPVYKLWKQVQVDMDEDERIQFAKSLAAQTKKPEFRAAEFLSGNYQPTPKQFFLANAHAFQTMNTDFIETFLQDYLKKDENMVVDVGLGTRLRMLGISPTLEGNDTLDEVRDRLEQVLKEGDRVAKVFTRAAETENPKDLSPEDHELLEGFGYIVHTTDAKTGESKEMYSLAHSRRTLGHSGARQQRHLNLPGAPMLDVISPWNVGKMWVSTRVIPFGAGRIASGLQGGMRTGNFLANRFFLEYTADFIWESGAEGMENYRRGQGFKVNWERNALDSFLLGPAMDVSGELMQGLLRAQARILKNQVKNPELKQFIKSAMAEDNLSFTKALFETIEDGLLLTADTSVAFAFQGILYEEELDSSDFLTMLLQGAMQRGYNRSRLTAKTFVASISKPKALRKAFDSNPRLRQDTIQKLEEGKARQQRVVEHFRKAVRETDQSAESHFYKNVGGDFTWKERKALRSEGEISEALMKKIDELRQNHFETLVHIARIDAIREINRSFSKFYEQALAVTGDAKEAAKLALERQKHELDVVMEKPFAPGSKDSTSDVDRATKSVYLRKHLVHIWDVYASRYANGEAPTSAKAFDVNEYINVFPFIKDNRKYAKLIQKENFEAGFGAEDMNHGQARLAISLSGAMRSMSEADMDLYLTNRRNRIVNRIQRGLAENGALLAFNNRAKWAKQHLLDSRGQLKVIANKIANGSDTGDPDVMLRAKEQLYNSRMEDVADLQWELSLLKEKDLEKSANALAMRAKIERDLSIAMRDGIETYTNTVGLDIIVNLVQRGTKKVRNDKGEIEEVELKTADRLDDPDFTIEGELGEFYTPEDIRGVIQDQVMFMAEHVKEFNHGLENEYLTGRALGKYLERYFLIEKILGMNIVEIRTRDQADPARRLLELSQALARHKNDPEKLLEALTNASRHVPGSPRNGLAELFYLMEEVVPGMRKMTKVLPPTPGSAPNLASAPSALLGALDKIIDPIIRELIAKVLEREKTKKHIIEEAAGGEGVLMYLNDELASIERELAYLREEQEHLLELARKYRQTDWEQVIQFEKEKAWVITFINHMPWANTLSKTYQDYQNRKLTKELQLEALKKPALNANVDFDQLLTKDPQTPEYPRIKNRIAWLEHKRLRFLKERESAEALAAKDAKFANLNLSGEWVCGLENDTPATARIAQQQDAVTMDLAWTRSNLKGPHVVFKAIHKRGQLIGSWHDQKTNTEPIHSDLRSRPTSLIFEGAVHATHNEFQITYGPKHQRNSVDWAGMKCRRHQEKTPTDIQFFKLSHGPVPADARMDEEETRGLLAVKENDPNGKSRSTPFKVYKGRRARSGSGSLWIKPGEYRVGVTVGLRLVTKKVKVTSRRRTVMTFSPGALSLEEKSTSGEPINSHVHVFDLEVGINSPLRTFSPSQGRILLLSPGMYKIQVDGAAFPWEDEIEIKPGKVTPISVEWATLRAVFDSNASPEDIYIRRAALGDSPEGWVGIGHNVDLGADGGVDIRLPKGDFELRIVAGGKTITRRVSIKVGEEKSLIIQP